MLEKASVRRLIYGNFKLGSRWLICISGELESLWSLSQTVLGPNRRRKINKRRVVLRIIYNINLAIRDGYQRTHRVKQKVRNLDWHGQRPKQLISIHHLIYPIRIIYKIIK